MAKPPVLAAQVAQDAVAELRKFWKAARESFQRLQILRKREPHAYQYGKKQNVLAEEAAKAGYNPDTMKKGWRVASEYTPADIKALCVLIKEHRAPFGPTHLIRLLTVKDRKRRDTLTRMAIKKRWSVMRLEQAILRQQRRRPLVGKSPHPPSDSTECLVVLEGLCLKWIRWCEAAYSVLPDDLLKLVSSATKAVNKVQDAVAGELQKLEDKAPQKKA